MFLKPYTRTAYYYETDQMAIIHHSNYIRWMEEARLDLLDQIGLNYRSIEEANLLIPVLSVSCNYQTLVHYDDTIIINDNVMIVKILLICIIYDSDINIYDNNYSTHDNKIFF